jgi:hypothetical protein
MTEKMRWRQVHLDFHTSEHCPDVGAGFDEEQFVGALKLGHVDTINLFGMGHHGWCYYPTKLGLAHPNLKTDLLGRQLRACADADIRTTVYITVGWNDKASREHPEWLVRHPDGTVDGPPLRHPYTPRPNGWYRLCTNSPYLDEVVLPVTREVMEMYAPSGIWLDITGEYPCTCRWCREGMAEAGLDVNSDADRAEWGRVVYKDYLRKANELIHGIKPDTTIYHNSSEKKGRHDLYPYWTHYEIESLPTASWGYNHFPNNARYFTMLPGMEIVGMTGKFHRNWGEFGGFKNPVALQYEVGQIVSLGCRCSIGDQLHPSGVADEETYRIIGEAYARVEEREEWLKGTAPVADVAVLAPSAVMKDRNLTRSEVGAGQMLMEDQIPFVVLDETMDFSPYKVLVLPDCVLCDEALAKKLNGYVAGGGALLLSGESGLNRQKTAFVVPTGTDYDGPSPWDVEYVVVGDALAKDMVRSPFLVYQSGVKTVVRSAEVLAEAWQPYFSRTYEHFCSHGSTPQEGPAGWPAVSREGRVIHIAQPIFRVYESMGMQLHRDLVLNCLDLLYPDRMLDVDLKSCGRVGLMRQEAENRLLLHLMYAVPIRRGSTEVIEDIVTLTDVEVALAVDAEPARVYLAPSREELAFEYSGGEVRFAVPKIEMNQIVAVEF